MSLFLTSQRRKNFSKPTKRKIFPKTQGRKFTNNILLEYFIFSYANKEGKLPQGPTKRKFSVILILQNSLFLMLRKTFLRPTKRKSFHKLIRNKSSIIIFIYTIVHFF